MSTDIYLTFSPFVAYFSGANLTSAAIRHTWVQAQVQYIQTNFLDGINVDFEEEIAKTNQAERDGLTLLMWELYGALKTKSLLYQVNIAHDSYGWCNTEGLSFKTNPQKTKLKVV